VNSILEDVTTLMEKGWNATPSFTPSESQSESTLTCDKPGDAFFPSIARAYGPHVVADCKSPCTQKYACVGGLSACIQRCSMATEEERKTGDYLDDPDAIPQGLSGNQAQAAPISLATNATEPPTESTPSTETVMSKWREASTDAQCAGVPGYFHPGENQIVMCVDKDSPVRRVTRDGFRATLLHEYFHRALGDTQVDIYSNTPLYPMLSALQIEIDGDAGTKVNETLALLNPDSLVEFVLRAAGASQPEVHNAVAQAEPASGTAGACKIRRAQFALGVAYQWINWGMRVDAVNIATHEREIATKSPTSISPEEIRLAERRLARLEEKKRFLTEPEKKKRKKDSMSAASAHTTAPNPPPPAELSALKPPSVNVTEDRSAAAGTLERSESVLKLTVPSSFFTISDLDSQVREILGYMKISGEDIVFLEGVSQHGAKKEDSAILTDVEAGLSQC
jgi:hypothetical protein